MNEKLVLEIELRNRDALNNLGRFDAEMDSLRRSTLDYRSSLQKLNAEFAENRQKLLTANTAEKELLETRNRVIRINQGMLRSEKEAASIRLANLTQERRELERLERAAESANRKRSFFGGRGGGGSFGDTVMGAMGVVYSAQELGRLADTAFRLGDRLEGVHRGLEQVYGSSQRASERFAELNELAKLPGLDPEPLAKYDAMFKNLGATAEENNILFTGTAKAITTFGGDVFGVNSALLQLSQGFAKNKIDMQDWKSINEQTGGTVIKVAEDVLNFTGGIEGMRKAFKESGTTLQDFLMPVFVELNNRFEGAPVDSYTNRIDNLNVAFKNYIGTVTRGNTVVSGFLETLTGFFEGEAEAWRGSRSAGEAIKATGDAAKVSAAEIAVLQKDLGRVNTTLDTATEKFNTLKEQGINENTASMQQLSRRIEFLEERKAALSGQVDTAKNAMQEMLKPTENISTEFRVLTQEVEQVDTRFLTFKERGVALKAAIAELSPEITRINELLPNTSVHAEKLDTYFNNLKVSTVNLTAEQKALNLIFTEGISELNDYAPALNLTAHEANLVDPAIKRMATAAREMNVETKLMKDELRDDLVPTLGDVYERLDKTANEAMADLITNAGNAQTELDRFDEHLASVYDNLDKITNETDVPGVITDISDAIGNDLGFALKSLLSGGDLEVTLQDLGGNMGRSFVEGLINEWTNEQVKPRINDAFGRLISTLGDSGVITGAASLAGPVAVFAGSVAAFAAAGEAWVSHFGGETRQEPIDDYMRLIAGASGLTLPGLQRNFGEWTGGALDFSGLLTSLTAPTDEGAAALASRRYNLYQSLTGRPQATPQSEADRIAYESGMMSPAEAEAYLAGYPEPEQTPSTRQRSSSAGGGSAQVDTEKIGDVHRFSGAESGQLKTLEGTLKEKRTDFIGLSDVDFSVILDKYGEYTQAILNFYNAKMGFIQNAPIDAQAKETAMTLALQEYHALTFRANRDLEAVMPNSNLELASEFSATTGALARNQILKRLVVPDGPRSTSRSDSGPKMVTSTFVATGRERAETHRFTSAQSGELRNIEGRAKQAATDFRNLQTKDFSEILTAYGTYTEILQEVYNKRVEFINSAHLTEGAKETALTAALIAFQDDTYSANQLLARVMQNSDMRLITEFDATTGILPRNQIVRSIVVPEDAGGTARSADPGPKMVTTTFTPTGRERAETHRFTSAQSGELKNIEGRAKQAREVLRQSEGQDFLTIVEAYDMYVGLLQEVYNARVAFINSAHLTEGAKKTALDAALIAFQDDTYSANQLLARVMAASDLTLTSEFAPTTGALRSIAFDEVTPDASTSGRAASQTQRATSETRTRARGETAAPLETQASVSAFEKMAELNLQRLDVMAKEVYIDTEKLGAKMGGPGGGRTGGPLGNVSDDKWKLFGFESPEAWQEWLDRPSVPGADAGNRIPWWQDEEKLANFREGRRRAAEEPLSKFFEDNPTYQGETLSSALGASGSDFSVVARLLNAINIIRNDNDPSNDYLIADIERQIEAIRERAATVPGFHRESLENLLRGGMLDQRVFHFPETDRTAMVFGKQTARAIMPTLDSPTPVQRQNAQDFSQNFSQGMIEGMRDAVSQAMQGGGGQNVNVTVMVQLDRNEIITPEFTEQISDQMALNQLNGFNRR